MEGTQDESMRAVTPIKYRIFYKSSITLYIYIDVYTYKYTYPYK